MTFNKFNIDIIEIIGSYCQSLEFIHINQLCYSLRFRYKFRLNRKKALLNMEFLNKGRNCFLIYLLLFIIKN